MIPNVKPNYLLAIFVIISQACNVLFFQGWPDEMFSARCYREFDKDIYLFGFINTKVKYGTVEEILDKLFFWQQKHCYECYIWEVARIDLGGMYDLD